MFISFIHVVYGLGVLRSADHKQFLDRSECFSRCEDSSVQTDKMFPVIIYRFLQQGSFAAWLLFYKTELKFSRLLSGTVIQRMLMVYPGKLHKLNRCAQEQKENYGSPFLPGKPKLNAEYFNTECLNTFCCLMYVFSFSPVCFK